MFKIENSYKMGRQFMEETKSQADNEKIKSNEEVTGGIFHSISMGKKAGRSGK